MEASLAPRSRRGLWPTKGRRHRMSTTTRRTPQKRTATRLSTVASVSTTRWQQRWMGRTLIRARSPLMQKSWWGWEEGRSMAGTGLETAWLTPPVLLLSRRFELGAPALARLYAHVRALRRFRWRHWRLFLLQQRFINFDICFLVL